MWNQNGNQPYFKSYYVKSLLKPLLRQAYSIRAILSISDREKTFLNGVLHNPFCGSNVYYILVWFEFVVVFTGNNISTSWPQTHTPG